ncbi:type IV toxin-antitoxin system YeeU family antitoxin [Salmonella enterica subsp. enterica serovar Sangera]|nr:type IV toxin-antitoxin system YeeU family antitoxin [Salmonella enterica subsp. enterica serovar Mississippi]EHP4799772.1 type IV toxin-antitoxin system YeeU family antitoxin [Salmonella enterica subsp. enterica serovar Sangera]EHP4802413.1 type IV toxin-antitoxin system YeeU family antitoxin [Salmonella enterica subsp. enterica serovar Sangera]
MEKHDKPEWGLRCEVMPRFSARLVQEGNRLHYLADRAGITGAFNEEVCHQLNAAFPHFIKQMELMLLSGELNSRHAHRVTLYHNELTCDADTHGSCGYVYIAIYPTQR